MKTSGSFVETFGYSENLLTKIIRRSGDDI